MAFTLRVTQGDGEPEDLSFDAGEVRMGRTADNDVVIKDPSSSRSHARVYEEDGRYFVEDLKSANGTTLNRHALKAPAALESGDRIAIGGVVLEFITAAEPSTTLDGEEEPPAEVREVVLRQRKRPERAIVRPQEDLNQQAYEPTAPTAADRARERRELQRSSVGKLQVLWNEFPRPTKAAVGTLSAAVIVGMLGLLVMSILPKRVVKRTEQAELVPNAEPIPHSFGLGDGVDFERSDLKSFSFTFAAPTRLLGVLHYQARECSKDEVSIELNGVQLGTVPPDTVAVDERQLEVVLPADQVRVNAANEVVFDNVNNPPAHDPWRIWNVKVEVIPVPRLSADEAARRAKNDLERASEFYDLRGVGAKNLFRAWKQYRDAWLLLQATPDSLPELLTLARTRMNEIRKELDKTCSSLLVSYRRHMSQKYPNTAMARRILQDIPSYFEKDHPCLGTSRRLLSELEDLGVVE